MVRGTSALAAAEAGVAARYTFPTGPPFCKAGAGDMRPTHPKVSRAHAEKGDFDWDSVLG